MDILRQFLLYVGYEAVTTWTMMSLHSVTLDVPNFLFPCAQFAMLRGRC